MHLCVEPPVVGRLCAVLCLAAQPFHWLVRHCEGLNHVSGSVSLAVCLGTHSAPLGLREGQKLPFNALAQGSCPSFSNKGFVGLFLARWMPGFGAMTALCGGIMIKRGKKGTMQQCLEQSADRLAMGVNVGLFPQGTRKVPSLDKGFLEFKKGFVVMAAKVSASLR